VFRTLELRVASPPSHNEHVIPRISVFGRPWLSKDGHLLEDLRGDTQFLLKLPNKGLGWNLASIAVSAGDVPHRRIEQPIVRAPG
jgi:hypothetical protein